MYKVPAQIGNKGNETSNKAAKEAKYMPRIASIRLPYTRYYPTIKRARNSEWQKKWRHRILVNYITINPALKSGKVLQYLLEKLADSLLGMQNLLMEI